MKLIIDENIVFFLNKIYLDNVDIKDESLIEKKLIIWYNKQNNINMRWNMIIAYAKSDVGKVREMNQDS